MTKDPLLIISNNDANERELLLAIQELGAITEAPGFWADIANSADYKESHRRHSVFQLFRRHVTPGMKLSELAQVLDNPNWLKDEDLQIVGVLAGRIPVQWTLEDTVFVVLVFPESSDGDNWAIYLRVSGKVGRDNFIKLLRGEDVNQETKDATILEIGFTEPYRHSDAD